MSKLTSFVKKSASEAALAIVLVLLPAVVVLLKLPETTLAGCPPYGYSCGQVACFALEVTTDGGYTWNEGSVYIYGTPGLEIDVQVRTVLAVLSGGIEGWSFSVRHNTSQVDAAGGSFTLRAVRPEDIYSVRCGSAPSFDSTQMRPCGYTQGVVIDSSTSACKLNAPAERVTSSACYRVVMPQTVGVYPVTLEFTDDVGDPSIHSIVTQNSQTKTPCKFNLTLNLYSSNSYYPTYSYCPITIGDAISCSGDGGGGGGGPPTLDGMVKEGVEYLLDKMNASQCATGLKDRWYGFGTDNTGDNFYRTVATTAICAEALLIAPEELLSVERRNQRNDAIRNATRFLYNNAVSLASRCCSDSQLVCPLVENSDAATTACKGEAWVSFPLQYFVRLQEVIDETPTLATTFLAPNITVASLRNITNQMIDAILECIDTSDHQGLPRYGFAEVEGQLITAQPPFKLAPALLALKRAERFSATHPDVPFCFSGARRGKLNKALDALYRSRVCGEIEFTSSPRIYDRVTSSSCHSCNDPEPCGAPLDPSCIRNCEKTECDPQENFPCAVGTCQPANMCDSGVRLHAGAFTYSDRRLASSARSLTPDPDRASVPGSAGRTPICEAALHAWRWPCTLDDVTREARIAAAIDVLFPEDPMIAPRGLTQSGEEMLVYDLYNQALETNLPHGGRYGLAVYYFLFAHYSAAMAIEALPPSHPSLPFWREQLVDKLASVRGTRPVGDNDPRAWHDNFITPSTPNARNYGTGMALLSLLASRPRQHHLGPCPSVQAPVLPLYKRGDADGNGFLQITDLFRIFNWLFAGQAVDCEAALDSNGDRMINISDVIHLSHFLHLGGPPPPPPHPQCGFDLAPGPLSCLDYPCPPSANLSKLAGHQSETTVAINECSEGGEVHNVFVASNHWPASTNVLGPGLFRAASWDGGVTWPVQGLIFEAGALAAFGDPVATFDRHGNLYLTYIGDADGYVHVAISTDGGLSFTLDTVMEEMSSDRPTIAVGPACGGNPEDVSVWVTWKRSGVRLRGATVSGRLTCPPEFGPTFLIATNISETVVAATDLAVGPSGEVLITYMRYVASGANKCPTRLYTRYRQEGSTYSTSPAFQAEVEIAELKLCGNHAGGEEITPVIFMAYGKPNVVWDHLAGKAYVAFLDGQESNPTIDEAETRIFLRSAAPPFTSWTPAAAVRPWSPGSPFFEFHHGLALDPGPGSTQGHLALCWYDTVADSTDRRRCHFRAAVSRDQARRFKEMESPLSLGQSDIGAVNPITDQRLYGDYVGIRFRKGVYVPAWSANTHGGGNPDAKAEVFSVRVDIEICDDGIDNDGDNLVDCGDPDCCGPLCPPSALCPEVCDDGVDNDGDDLVDCADPDCFPTGLCPEICDDEVDNDGDELVDCDDPDCVSECP